MLRKGSGKKFFLVLSLLDFLVIPNSVLEWEENLHTVRNLKLFLLAHSISLAQLALLSRGELERLFIEINFLLTNFARHLWRWFLWLERFMINVTLIIAFKVLFFLSKQEMKQI